jgi:hypothetical protein
MKNRTRQHFVISPGLSSGMAFVSWDPGEDPYLRADDYFPEGSVPVERREGIKRNWMQAMKHLPKVWTRLVPQSLWRQAVKPAASA